MHTSRNGYVRLILKHMFEIANSKFEWSDHQMQTKSMDIHDETLLYGYSQGDLTVEIGTSFACNSIPINHKTYTVKSKFHKLI